MFRFRLAIAGEVQMDRAIARFADGVTDYRPVWAVIEDDFYAQEKDQFRTEGEEGGEHWQALSEDYAKWKEAHFPGKPILERTGNLRSSLTSPSDPNTVRVEERKTLTLGTRLQYALYHQSPEERKVLPRRPEIMLTEEFKRSVMHHVHAYLVQMATNYGFRQGLQPTAAAKLGRIFGAGIAPRGTSPRRSREGGMNF